MASIFPVEKRWSGAVAKLTPYRPRYAFGKDQQAADEQQGRAERAVDQPQQAGGERHETIVIAAHQPEMRFTTNFSRALWASSNSKSSLSGSATKTVTTSSFGAQSL